MWWRTTLSTVMDIECDTREYAVAEAISRHGALVRSAEFDPWVTAVPLENDDEDEHILTHEEQMREDAIASRYHDVI